MATDSTQTRQKTALELIWHSPWVRALAYIALIVLGVLALWRLRQGYAFAMQVAIIGFTLAYILNPLVELLGRWHIRRSFAVVMVYIILIIVIFLGSLLITQVVTETERFVRLIPDAVAALVTLLERGNVWFEGLLTNLPDFILERFIPAQSEEGVDIAELARSTVGSFLQQIAEAINTTLQNLLSSGGTALLSGVANVLATTLQVFLILVASAYFLFDYRKITTSFKRYVPLHYRPLYRDIISKADRTIGGYLRGQLLIAVLLGIMVWIGLTIVGVPLALAISFLAAVFNVIPYLGPIIGTIPAALLGLTESPLTALLAILVFFIANQFEGNILSPMILSRSTNLHPVTVLLSILAGAGMLGLIGALIAVPVVSLTKVILEDYLLTRPAYMGSTNVVIAETDMPAPPQSDTTPQAVRSLS
jgi:predicted PurR-regulated permease PerM